MSEESKSWYLTGDSPVFNNGFESDEFMDYGQIGFREVLDSFLGRAVKLYPKSMAAEPVEVRAILQNATSDSVPGTAVRQILTELGQLHCGQYAVEENGRVWLVSTMPDNNLIYEKAVLWKCRHTLRMKNAAGGVSEYPVYVTDGSGSGETDRPNLTVGAAAYKVFLPFNQETAALDNGFRFIMDKNRTHPTVFRVERADPISYAVGGELEEDGLVCLTCTETQFNPAVDSAREMVADWFGDRTDGPVPDAVPEEGAAVPLKLDVRLDDDEIAIGEVRTIPILGGDGSACKVTLMPQGLAELVNCDGRELTVEAVRERRHIGKDLTVLVEQSGRTAEAVLQIVSW